jgi:hypothetical protein
MPIGKGGSSGNQSQNSSGTFGGNSSNAGINGSYQSGVGGGMTTAIAPTGYEDAWRSMLGTGGANPGQASAMNFFSNGGANSLVNPERNGWYGAIDRNNNIQGLANPGGFNATYGPTPQASTPGNIVANTGASFMSPYQQGYTNDVVNAATNDLTNQYNKNLNASNMAGTAAGGFANSRMGLRDAAVQNDFLRTLGTTTAGLRDQGFTRAMSGGQFDATNNLAAATQNEGNRMATDQFNQQLKQQRDMFGANTQLTANQNQMGNTATAANIGMNAANSAANVGNMGFNQNLQALTAGAPLFGQANSNYSNLANKGGQLGTSDTAGQQDSTSSGKNSSKGGGMSVGP